MPSRCSRSPSAPGSKRRSRRGRRRRRRWPGRRSPRASTCSWSRRRGPARRWPRSWRSSTGSSATRQAGTLGPGLRCVYVSPLRSLNYDIERNLAEPLEGIASPARARAAEPGPRRRADRRHLGLRAPQAPRRPAAHPDHDAREPVAAPEPGELAGRTGSSVEHLIVDEVHALAPTKRGADLAVSLERLAAQAVRDPCRVGLSATCRPDEPVARFLVGPSRSCRVIEAPPPDGTPPMEIDVESLIRPGEAPHRGLSYRRLLRRLRRVIDAEPDDRRLRQHARLRREDHARPAGASELGMARRSVAERTPSVLHGVEPRRRRSPRTTRRSMRSAPGDRGGAAVGRGPRGGDQHQPGAGRRHRHGRPDGPGRPAGRRVAVRAAGGPVGASAGRGVARAVAGGDARRAGRRGDHGAGRSRRAGRAARGPSRRRSTWSASSLVGMACAGEQSVDAAFALIRKAGPMAELTRADFDACLAFLAGELAAPAGAFEPEPGAAPRWTSPRIWKRDGWFGVRNGRVARWFRGNVGTITSEESVRVLDGRRGGRHARGVVRRAAIARRPVRARRPRAGVPPARGLRSSTPVRPAASRACRAGRATASRSRPSWPSSWPAFATRRPGGSATRARGAPRLAGRRLRPRPRRGRRDRRAVRGPGAVERGPRRRRACWSRSRPRRRPGPDLHLPRSPAPRGVRGAGAGDRGPAGPAVRPQPGAGRRRPRLVDPAARGRDARRRRDLGRSWIPSASPTTCSRGSTGASCWRGGSGTSPRRR